MACELAAPVDLGAGGALLWAHVGGGAHHHTRLRQLLAVGRRADGARDAEVGDHGRSGGQEDVLGLDVPMHDAVRVRISEGARRLRSDAEGFVNRQLLIPP